MDVLGEISIASNANFLLFTSNPAFEWRSVVEEAKLWLLLKVGKSQLCQGGERAQQEGMCEVEIVGMSGEL